MAKVKKYIKKGLKKVMPGNLPDFIIIGAQKSGTSSLHYYLSQHPNLSASNPKETHYFDRVVHHGKSLKWYKKQFLKKKFKSQLYYEATPNYIYYESVAKQISALIPDIKLILILREPVSRAYSAWNMYRDFFQKNEAYRIKKEQLPGKENPIYKYLYKNRSSFPSFLEAVRIEQELIRNNGPGEPAILRRGLYAEQIGSYLKYFDRDQMLILGYKKFIKDPIYTINKVARFLEVETVSADDMNTKPRNKRAYERTMTQQEKGYISNIYKEPNEKLFNLLGNEPEW